MATVADQLNSLANRALTAGAAAGPDWAALTVAIQNLPVAAAQQQLPVVSGQPPFRGGDPAGHILA